MNDVALALPMVRGEGAEPSGPAARAVDRPYIMSGAGPIAAEIRARVAIWVNEGGAGGEVER